MGRNVNEEPTKRTIRRHHFYVPAGRANYTELDSGRVLRAIEIISANGGAIRFGKTRDGGAFAIGVYGDGGEPYTDYLRPTDDVTEYLETLVDAFQHTRDA